MNDLIIGGYNMNPGDGAPYWSIADASAQVGNAVRVRSCGPTNADEDVMWADRVVCYSYGMARFKKTIHDLASEWPDGKKFPLVVVVAGVPDAWMFQFYGSLWHLPPFVERGVCFQVDAIPVSCTLKESCAVSIELGDPIPNVSRVNVNCNWLVSSFDPIGKHTRIQNHPQLIQAVSKLLAVN